MKANIITVSRDGNGTETFHPNPKAGVEDVRVAEHNMLWVTFEDGSTSFYAPGRWAEAHAEPEEDEEDEE